MRGFLANSYWEALLRAYAFEVRLPGSRSVALRVGPGPHEKRPEALLEYRATRIVCNDDASKWAVIILDPVHEPAEAKPLDPSWFLPVPALLP